MVSVGEIMVDVSYVIEVLLKLLQVIFTILTIIGTIFTVYQAVIHFWPEKEYMIRYKITKPFKKFINRNLPINFSFFKSCDIVQNIDRQIIFNEIITLFSSKQNVVVEHNGDCLKIHFNENNFSFDYTISFEEYDSFDGWVEYILIKQSSTINFKNVFSFLSNSFWILRDLMEVEYIRDETKKIDIVMSCKKFTFFDNALKLFGDIVGNEITIYKSEDIVHVSMNVPYNLNSIHKIMGIILLNLPN